METLALCGKCMPAISQKAQFLVPGWSFKQPQEGSTGASLGTCLLLVDAGFIGLPHNSSHLQTQQLCCFGSSFIVFILIKKSILFSRENVELIRSCFTVPLQHLSWVLVQWCPSGKALSCGPKEGHGSRAELKARLGLEVAHLIGLPKKGFMEVGYFRMMETSRWFCRKEGVAMRLWSPAANLSPWFCLSGCSTLLTQPSVLRRFKWSVSLHPQRQCCQRLKKVSHGLWQKNFYLLRLTRLENSSLFQRFPIWLWASPFH